MGWSEFATGRRGEVSVSLDQGRVSHNVWLFKEVDEISRNRWKGKEKNKKKRKKKIVV